MTVLNFMLSDQGVYLVTDTLVSDPSDMGPRSFTAKVYPMPNWEGLICGTGGLGFIAEWNYIAITSILALDIRDLDQHVPDALRNLHRRHQDQADGEIPSTTIYHFGYDRNQGRFIGFAYRSTNDFSSEEFGPCYGVKPDLEDPQLEINEPAADFIAIAERQKQLDGAIAPSQRVGVGGHLVAYAMQLAGSEDDNRPVQIACWRCHEFPDFRELYNEACARMKATT